jgi:two-component system cell cycle response regulator
MAARILIVEDNATNLDLMQYLLEAFGHSVTRASSAVDGLEHAKASAFDLILADILMPEIDGYEFLARVKRDVTNCAPVIAVTALAMVGDRERVLQSGFNGYIPKPINPETFVHEVDGYLSASLRSVSPKGVQTAAEHAPLAKTPRTQTILVVDDLPTNAMVIRAAIEPFGYRILEAGSMQAALELAALEVPDLVISDVHMPHGTGYDLIEAFRADRRLAEVPFIFLSSTYQHESYRARGLALGAERYLMRPIEPQKLLDEVAATLDGAKE